MPKVRLSCALALALASLSGPPTPTGRGSAPPTSSPSATRTSPARPAAGPATRTTAQQYVDALGSTAYYDNASNTASRSRAATARRSAEVSSAAASTARTSPARARGRRRSPTGVGNFKPGLDFYDDGAGHQGQALMLQNFAATPQREDGRRLDRRQQLQLRRRSCHVRRRTSSFSPSWWKDYCNDDSSVTANFTSANVTAQTTAIKNAILNVRTAMANAGYARIAVHDRRAGLPVADPERLRASATRESGYTRQITGGCGFWNADANWANSTALPTINNAVKNAATQAGPDEREDPRAPERVQRPPAVREHGRAARGGGLRVLEQRGRGRQDRVGPADPHRHRRLRLRLLHPGVAAPELLGQLALRNCVRQAYNGGAPRGGTCSRPPTGMNAAASRT